MSIIVFPGQGSQYLNMGIDFNKNYEVAKTTFQEIEDSCKINIRKIITENQSDNLNQTIFTQISIFSVSMAIYQTLLNQIGKDFINPEVVLGHSLGEYSSLVANNMMSLRDASILIKKRGELMNSSIEPNTSGMAAVIGKNAVFVEKIIRNNNLDITIANDNSPMQVVVSGLNESINSSEEIFSNNGVKKYIKLNVSAAFHSKYMLEAQVRLIEEINNITFKKSHIPIVSNYDACINSDLDKVIFSLKNQMANKVKWTESIKKLEQKNINKIIEIGPGNILSGLISRISKKFDIKTIDKMEDLEKFN